MNDTYGSSGASELRDAEQQQERVIRAVEDRFRTMPPGTPEFNHYAAPEHVIKHRDVVFKKFPDLGAALGRFEAIFKALNGMLP